LDSPELAQRTYVNATMEKLALIGLVKRNEDSRREYEEKMDVDIGRKLDVGLSVMAYESFLDV